MSWFFTPHSRTRFQERYGFRPSVQDLSETAYACKDGRAVLMRTREDGCNAYCWTINDTRVYPVVSPEWVIITFLPPDFFFAASAKAHRRASMNAMGKMAKRYATGIKDFMKREPYKRDRTPAARLVVEE